MTLLMSKMKMWAQLFTRSRVALTDQELETLRLMHSGLRQSEAAELMSISVSGLKARLDSAQKKLGARNTTSAVSTAVRMNLI
ncbi:response regulator transcription factor [Paracoccus yeei]|uniref:response regulator transcription factor n=1 Tax=Paracoccus yeei TaxID=147645 RepID=UPI0035E3D6CE